MLNYFSLISPTTRGGPQLAFRDFKIGEAISAVIEPLSSRKPTGLPTIIGWYMYTVALDTVLQMTAKKTLGLIFALG